MASGGMRGRFMYFSCLYGYRHRNFGASHFFCIFLEMRKGLLIMLGAREKRTSGWGRIKIVDANGNERDAQALVIVSASRSTDIPAFYADWFMERLHQGYVCWTTPFNNTTLYVSFAKTRLIVFWSKNSKPMIPYLAELDKIGYHYYFQFTLNDDDAEEFEPAVPSVVNRIETFKALPAHVGRNRVIGHFVPLLLTDGISIQRLLSKAKRVDDAFEPYTSRMVPSFADIHTREFTKAEMNEFADGLSELNKEWAFRMGTCTEKINLDKYGIGHNHYADDYLMAREFDGDSGLMKFLGYNCSPQHDFSGEPVKNNLRSRKDKGQRIACGCVASKDIGEYNARPHCCLYCCANSSGPSTQSNYRRHPANPHSASIPGESNAEQVRFNPR